MMILLFCTVYRIEEGMKTAITDNGFRKTLKRWYFSLFLSISLVDLGILAICFRVHAQNERESSFARV